MIIEKNGKTYFVTECRDKWTVKVENGKLLVAFDISKELCSTADELRKYILNNKELFQETATMVETPKLKANSPASADLIRNNGFPMFFQLPYKV